MLVPNTPRKQAPWYIHHRGVKTPQCIHQQGVVVDTGEPFKQFEGAYNNLF
jgi:hypothetical protein